MVKNRELQVVIVDILDKYEEVECMLKCVIVDFVSMIGEVKFMFEVNVKKNVMVEEFLDDFLKF